ncbi:MAG: peptidase M48, partial [Betaproteobacteria bacterium]|nr:peptidase M48 [Betaproteobacteria bacterium]
AAGSNPQAATALIAGGQAVAVQGQLNFSREMEREADRVGYSVMTGSGYAPQGFVTMFEKLLQANRFNDTGAFPYLRSHPLTTERIADMQARQQLLPIALPVSDLTHYLLAGRARALSYLGVDAQRGLMAMAMPAAASGLQAAKPEVRAGMWYAAVLAASNQRDFRQAWAWHNQLEEATRMNSAASRLSRLLAVEVALAEGQPSKALEWLGKTWNPKSRSEILLWSRAVLASAQGAPQTTPAAQASTAAITDLPMLVPRLQAWVATYPRDAQAWQLLSSAYLIQGKTLRAVCAEAEGFAAKFDEQGALNRYRAAQDLVKQSGQTDFIEASIIDTRVRQLQARVFELSMER